MVTLSIQLYSIREALSQNPIQAIEKLLAIGFRHLEPANSRGHEDPGIGGGIPAAKLMEVLAPYGARLSSAHMGPLTMQTIPTIAAYHQQVGNANIVEAIQFFTGYDMLMRRCEEYNQIGKYLVERGQNPLLYHNHYHEYQLLGGKPILYHILENTDPAYLQLEMDTGWVMRAGRDPVAEMTYAASRLRLIHIKDFSHTPVNLLIGKEDAFISWETFGANHQAGDVMKSENFVELGTGIMPIQEILDTANALNVAYAVLEQDDSAIDIFEHLRGSYANARRFRGLAV